MLSFAKSACIISKALREKRVPAKKAPVAKNFLGGAASCRSIFVIFSRKLQALKARQNTGTRIFKKAIPSNARWNQFYLRYKGRERRNGTRDFLNTDETDF